MSRTMKKNQSVPLILWSAEESKATKVRSRLLEGKKDGEKEPSLMGWEEVDETPSRMVKKEGESFIGSGSFWDDFRYYPSAVRKSMSNGLGSLR